MRGAERGHGQSADSRGAGEEGAARARAIALVPRCCDDERFEVVAAEGARGNARLVHVDVRREGVVGVEALDRAAIPER